MEDQKETKEEIIVEQKEKPKSFLERHQSFFQRHKELLIELSK